jgi:4-alpha-glucanotransferase
MTISFNINYYTHPGQEIYVCGSSKELGNWEAANALKMNYQSDGNWSIQLNLNKTAELLEYKYFLNDGYGNIIWEDGPDRIINLSGQTKPYIHVIESWRALSNNEKVMFTSAFTDVVMKPSPEASSINYSKAKKNLQFKIQVPRIGHNHCVCVLGNSAKLGNWDITKPLLLGYGENFPLWTGSISTQGIKLPLRYKYGIYDLEKKKVVTLEEGFDREIIFFPKKQKEYHQIISDERFRYPVGNWKAAGASVPVFSLRTETNFGVGEFNDLFGLIDWAKAVGLKMIQLLPVNETIATHTWLDSYPYKSISVIALHPIYLNLEKVGKLKNKKVMDKYKMHQERLNKLETVDYPEVLKLKSAYYKLAFDEVKETFFKQDDYLEFFKKNKDWLIPYAAFAYLRDKNGTADFRKWKTNSIYNAIEIEKLCKPGSMQWDDISVHYFLQFHLDKQLMEVTNYARESGIVLKGDIPIGISPKSVEAWQEPHLFNLNAQAGAPPDDFALKGQNWGFPTYNWWAMEKENYIWWKKRLQKMGQYFDAYRIDHILGFFRIWEIPLHAVEGLLGYFNPALPLSAEEINSFGMYFDYERMVLPYIRQHIVESIFGEHAEKVTSTFLDIQGGGHYKMKDQFDTQLKVNQYFLKGIEEEDLSDTNRRIRDGLFELIGNVLFIQTGDNEWHPRISFHSTGSYADLDDSTKNALNEIYTHYFYKRHDDFWYHKGMEKLPAIISASNMLVCGEDLGMVPDCVPPVMDQLAILSLEIQRMSKDPEKKYAHPADAPYLSVCTTSTHDMSTIRGWWEEKREKIQEFYNNELGNHGEAPFYAEPWICQQMIAQHVHSPAMWTTFPIQDLIAMDGDFRWSETHKEKINEPSNVRHKWRFRMHQTVKELQQADNFNRMLKYLIEQSGRDTDY